MHLKKLITDIRFWIVVFFVIRLLGITNPPLEVAHNWRQVTVTMVSRNFLEIDNNIFYPRIDIAGEKTGITGMEFPLLNYLIYLISKLFGYQHWYGRLINLVISSLGLWFFYRLLNKYFSEQVSFYSTIILTVSIWFQFSRKIMPDTFSMSMVIASIYYGTNYLESKFQLKKYLYLLSCVSLMLLGILSKLPSAYLLIVFGIFMVNGQIDIKRKLLLALVSLIWLMPAVYWYFFWVPHLVDKFGFYHFFMGNSFAQGYNEIILNLADTLKKFYDTALKFIGFAVFLFGLIISIIKKERVILTLFILTFLGFCIVIFKAGFNFPHHSYYVIPFVPVMALIAGYGLTKIGNPKIALLVLIAISFEGIANQQHDFRVKKKDNFIVNLESELDKISHRDDLIIINSGAYPTPMYFAHRKGWVNSNEIIKDSKYINELVKKGLKYLVILKTSFGTEIKLEHYEKVFESQDYCVYKAKIITTYKK